MKKLLTILLLLTYGICWGQTFAPIGAKWYYSAQASGMAPQNSEYYLYESQLDTIVGGHNCKKISVTYYKYLNGDTAYLPPVYTYQSADTVYYYNTIFSNYFPLYIFNVVQGDTLRFHRPDLTVIDTTWRAVVDSVTSLIISTDTLKRVWTTPLDSYSFHGSYIEKLGCDFLMLPQTLALIIEHDGPMRCYSDSTTSYSFNTLFPCDYRLTTGINESENTFGLSLFPNPVTNKLTITIDNYEPTEIILYDLASRKLLQQTFINSTIINTEQLAKGMYLYEVRNRTGIIKNGKVIKE